MLRRGASARTTDLVAKSLGISRSTRTVVMAVAAAVALNAAVAIQFLSFLGQAALLVIIFVSVGLGSSAISADVYSRSGQTVSNLRSIGAKSGSLSAALATATLGYGAGGSAVGAFLGAGLGLAIGNPNGVGVAVLADTAAVVVSSTAAVVAGVYLGARAVWRR
jgi:hypothetical protein